FTCTERHGVEYLLMQMTAVNTHVLIGGVDPGLCRVAGHLARKYRKLLLPWSCLEVPSHDHDDSHTSHEQHGVHQHQHHQQQLDQDEGSHVVLVTPTALQVAWAARAALAHMGWRHVCIVTLESSYWRGLAQTVDVELRAVSQQV
ncbi:hypothetical protein OTU49_008435, partial [Cherax quadricarinatus]